MKGRIANFGDRQHFEGKDDFFDEIRVVRDERGSPAEGLREDVKEAQPEEQREGEIEASLVLEDAKGAAKDHAEDEPVERQHRERVYECPNHAETAAFMPDVDFAQGELPDEVPVPPEFRDEMPGIEHRCEGGLGGRDHRRRFNAGFAPACKAQSPRDIPARVIVLSGRGCRASSRKHESVRKNLLGSHHDGSQRVSFFERRHAHCFVENKQSGDANGGL